MANSMMAVAALLSLVGLVFLGQGLGMIPGSMMTGDPTWAVVGAAMLGVGVTLGVRAVRNRR